MSHIENVTQKQQAETAESTTKEGYAPLTKSESMIDSLSRFIPFGSSEESEKITEERVNSFEADKGPSFLDKLDDDAIANMAIEQLLFLMWTAVTMDMQENNRITQKTIQFTRLLEEKRMKETEEAYTSMYMYMKSAANIGGAFAGDTYGLALKGVGGYADNYDQQGIQMAQMQKQLVTQMKQEQLQELQELVRNEEKAKQMIDQAMQLKLQAFQR